MLLDDDTRGGTASTSYEKEDRRKPRARRFSEFPLEAHYQMPVRAPRACRSTPLECQMAQTFERRPARVRVGLALDKAGGVLIPRTQVAQYHLLQRLQDVCTISRPSYAASPALSQLSVCSRSNRTRVCPRSCL